ncbi:c-type cytochrome [Polaromonas sp. JS666]|uniref:c-type cytochrome n=1 Tax=Polaromonas sp. (strain JS666 / ATCC BAA-500) TaxID=296591 RepID=UPI0000533E9A|nr:c-type cytochrome [Polaromonas sp. JS666]ABE43174.1 cytochrome c, class I [Polaromonas sp. JS666]
MNKLLTTIFAVAVSCVTVSSLAQEVKGDAKAGETKNAMCIGCHGIKGYQASFPEIYKVPMISGQGGKYIVAALNAYKKGERKHPTMRSIAESLNDQDIADLAAYYSTHGAAAGAELPAKPAKEPSADVQALLNKANCASCHGANFSKPVDPAYPKIAGQHSDYLFVALKAYKTDNNPKVGRGNAIMAGMAKQYTNAELKLLANYLASVDGELKVIPQSKFR